MSTYERWKAYAHSAGLLKDNGDPWDMQKTRVSWLSWEMCERTSGFVAAREFWAQHGSQNVCDMTRMAELHDDVEITLRASLSTSKQAGAEPVAWECRKRVPNNPTWSEWTTCLERDHIAIQANSLHWGMVYQSRALCLAAPGAAIAAREQEAAINPAVLHEALGYAAHWAAFEDKRGNTLDAQRVRKVIASLASREEAPATPPAATPAAPGEVMVVAWQCQSPVAGLGYSYTDIPEQRAELERNGWTCHELSRTAALTQPTTVQQALTDEQANEIARASFEKHCGRPHPWEGAQPWVIDALKTAQTTALPGDKEAA